MTVRNGPGVILVWNVPACNRAPTPGLGDRDSRPSPAAESESRRRPSAAESKSRTMIVHRPTPRFKFARAGG
jgi:hypothetical protein